MKDEFGFCPYCGKNVKIAVIEKDDKVTIHDREVFFKSHFNHCPVCNHDTQTMEQMDESLRLAEEAYENMYKTFDSDRICSIREKYNVSQKAFSIILGFGELTINSYEQGKIPSSSNRMLLELSEDSYCFYKMYGINKNKLSSLQRKKIEDSKLYHSWEMMSVVTENLESLLVNSGVDAKYEEVNSDEECKLNETLGLEIAA